LLQEDCVADIGALLLTDIRAIQRDDADFFENELPGETVILPLLVPAELTLDDSAHRFVIDAPGEFKSSACAGRRAMCMGHPFSASTWPAR
jgi:hypothetical protein